jgi:hypothetical protein
MGAVMNSCTAAVCISCTASDHVEVTWVPKFTGLITPTSLAYYKL